MTRELRDNIEIQYDTIAGLLNVMGEEGRLIRLRKSEQKVLWSLGEDGNRKRIKCQFRLRGSRRCRRMGDTATT